MALWSKEACITIEAMFVLCPPVMTEALGKEFLDLPWQVVNDRARWVSRLGHNGLKRDKKEKTRETDDTQLLIYAGTTSTGRQRTGLR